jgi:hypothetical protein
MLFGNFHPHRDKQDLGLEYSAAALMESCRMTGQVELGVRSVSPPRFVRYRADTRQKLILEHVNGGRAYCTCCF